MTGSGCLNQFQVIEFCCNRFLGIVFLKIFFIPNHNSFFLFAKGVNLEEKSCVSFENDTFKTCCRPTIFQQHLLAEALKNLSILDQQIARKKCKKNFVFLIPQSINFVNILSARAFRREMTQMIDKLTQLWAHLMVL